MRVVALTAVALALCALAGGADATVVDQFADFKSKFGRKYSTPEEEARRFRIFSANMERAAAIQSVNPHAKFGANEFADMTEVEFKTRHNAEAFYKKRAVESRAYPTEKVTAEEKAKASGNKVDWRQHGAVTPVKNQGQCGSCWSFSTTGGIEGQWFLSGNPLVSLSEQEFVSCDTTDHGCKGGLMDNAYQWVLNTHNGTLVTEASYPYVSGDGYVPPCNMTGKQNAAQIVGWANIEHNEDAMAAWVLTHGPLSIAVDASSWQMYTGGVMTSCTGLALDHGVLIVGFDDTANPPYWIVKNSWGPIWGEQGYMRVEKGNDQCMISHSPCTAKVTSVGPTPNPGPTVNPEPTPPSGPAPTPKPFTQGWSDIMSPPWMDGPQLTFGISCISGTDCYVVGGDNGAGFGAFHFNGQRNGYFRHVNQQRDGMMAMLMAVGVGGSSASPKGAVGGMDFGAEPQYLTGKFQLNNSLTLPFVVTQYISADRATGQYVLFADGFSGNDNDMYFSTNGGMDYTGKKITASVIDKNCSFANAQVVVDKDTWYVVAGGNPAPPPNNNPPPPPFPNGEKQPEPKMTADSCPRNRGFAQLLDGDVTVLHRKSQFHAIVKDNKSGKIRHAFVNIPKYLKQQQQQPLGEIGCPFVATIYKTTDGGNSWVSSFEAINKGFMMDYIDCANATHCVAVGGGANMSHTPGAHVYTTTDGGNTWTQTLFKPSTTSAAWFISGVQFVPGTSDVWVAGNLQSEEGGFAEFWYSSDAGMTWARKQQLNFVMVITDLSFAADGVGFATALTPLKDTTILRYSPNGEPATPAPVWNGNFTQKICPNTGDCSGQCQEASFPQNTCLNLTNGFSAQMECDTVDNVLIQRVYPLDRVCWGPAEEQIIPMDRCMVANPGTIEFSCGPSTNANARSDVKYTPLRGAMKPATKKH